MFSIRLPALAGGFDPIYRRSSVVNPANMESRTGNGRNASLTKVCDDVRTVVHDGRALLGQNIRRAKHQARQTLHETGEVIQEHPLQMVAVVFGIGLVAGLMLFSLFSTKDER